MSLNPLFDLDPAPGNPGLAAHQNFALIHARMWKLEALGTTGTVDLNFQNENTKTIDLTGNLTLTTSNLEPGKAMLIRIKGDTVSRALTLAGWRAVGAALPTTLAANKVGHLWLISFGTTDADVDAEWRVQP